MKVNLAVQQHSTRKRLYRRDALERLAEKICAGEGVDGPEVEVSVLFCDDAEIKALNKAYRGKNKATDVLSFEQEAGLVPGVRVLGDIVISLETVEGRGEGSPEATNNGGPTTFALHLLGYDHATAAERRCMTEKQAQYLGVKNDAAWRTDP